ncbi:MAG TPA: tripartite tricarboxylate transporter substrate-binding protein, partial [Xanthobacteraceae bacterium]|nr:tripartite tricarboxylate transporter substrate-binding protein [Xanthobacteraceae bacterium]
AAQVPPAFPQRQLTLIVPFSAGGPVDVLGRLLAQEYQARSNYPAIVENKAGASGNIGIEIVRKATPDGSTLLLIPAGNLTINPTLMPDLSFDVERDFAPVAMLASAPNVFIVSPKLGVTTIKQLIDKAKTKHLTYGSPGVGSQLHLAMELFKEKSGIDIQHVPYRGSSQALGDLLGDHIDILSTNLPAVLPAIKANSVVPLALTTALRNPLVADVPTLGESGIDGIDVTSWYGMLAPKAIPNEVRDAIYMTTKDVLGQPALQDKLTAQGLTVQIEAPDIFSARIKRETEIWARVIKTQHITAQ